MLLRHGIYSIDRVFDFLGEYASCGTFRGHKRVYGEIDGLRVHKNSERYPVFYKDRCTCVKCGLKARYFALEQHSNPQNESAWHFNLYGINEKGKEVLFTKDHIIPKAKGGTNSFSNYQTMCQKCNMEKGADIEQ